MKKFFSSIKELQERVKKARLNPCCQTRFPKELWEDISLLSKAIPLQTIAKELRFDLSFLRKKIEEYSDTFLINPSSSPTQTQQIVEEEKIEFQELLLQSPREMVSIELIRDNLKAKIEGPISCLSSLHALFKEDSCSS